jgi:hypothetical protein
MRRARAMPTRNGRVLRWQRRPLRLEQLRAATQRQRRDDLLRRSMQRPSRLMQQRRKPLCRMREQRKLPKRVSERPLQCASRPRRALRCRHPVRVRQLHRHSQYEHSPLLRQLSGRSGLQRERWLRVPSGTGAGKRAMPEGGWPNLRQQRRVPEWKLRICRRRPKPLLRSRLRRPRGPSLRDKRFVVHRSARRRRNRVRR